MDTTGYLPPREDDDRGFLLLADRLLDAIEGAFEVLHVVRVRGWFDCKWLGFSGLGRVPFRCFRDSQLRITDVGRAHGEQELHRDGVRDEPVVREARAGGGLGVGHARPSEGCVPAAIARNARRGAAGADPSRQG